MSAVWRCTRCLEQTEIRVMRDLVYLVCTRCHLELGVQLDLLELELEDPA